MEVFVEIYYPKPLVGPTTCEFKPGTRPSIVWGLRYLVFEDVTLGKTRRSGPTSKRKKLFLWEALVYIHPSLFRINLNFLYENHVLIS